MNKRELCDVGGSKYEAFQPIQEVISDSDFFDHVVGGFDQRAYMQAGIHPGAFGIRVEGFNVLPDPGEATALMAFCAVHGLTYSLRWGVRLLTLEARGFSENDVQNFVNNYTKGSRGTEASDNGHSNAQ